MRRRNRTPGAGAVSGSQASLPSRVRPKLERVQGLLSNAIWRLQEEGEFPDTLQAAHSVVCTWLHELDELDERRCPICGGNGSRWHACWGQPSDQAAGAEEARSEPLHVEMVLLDNWDPAARERILPDLVELWIGSDEVSCEAKLMLTLVIGEARTTFETAEAHLPCRVLQRPIAKLVLKLPQ